MADVEVKERRRRILVAVDESEESIYALSWCLKNMVSEKFKDTIVLLYVKPLGSVYPSPDGTGRRDFYNPEGYLFSSEIMDTMDKYSNEVADCVMEKAKRICRDLADQVMVEARIEGGGDARDVIYEMVEKLGADMLVMGSRGYGLIKRTFLGSVSNHCAQNVKCPVMIVKRPKSNETKGN